MMLILIFIAMLLVSFALVALFTRQTQWEKTVQRRVVAIQQGRPADTDGMDNAAGILKRHVNSKFPRLDEFLDHYQFTAGIRQLAIKADTNWTIGTFVVYSVATGGIFFLAGSFFLPVVTLDGALAIAGLCAPYRLLKYKSARRLEAFNKALPDSIDLMARALRAGHSLSSAIEVLSEQAREPVATEFNSVFRQQNFGLPLRDALLQMTDRVPSKDLQFMVTAMLVQKETGGNLTEILDRTTHVIRERLRIEGEVRIRTAQGKLTGWILSLLPVIMLFLLNMVNPGYSNILLQDPVGQKLLYIGAALIAIGSMFIRKIVDIQV